MKRCATGLNVRPFSVMMPTGPGGIGKSTDKAFKPRRLPLKRSVEPESTDKKCPVASNAMYS